MFKKQTEHQSLFFREDNFLRKETINVKKNKLKSPKEALAQNSKKPNKKHT